MELTLESAFSTGGMIGHLGNVLLVVSMLMRRMVVLRILVIASALIGIIYAFFWVQDPVSSFWKSLLVTVNIVQLYITWRQNSKASFTTEERLLLTAKMRGLDPGEQRKLFDLGEWVNLSEGTELTRQGVLPTHLMCISEGRAEIMIDDVKVAEIPPGGYVGEMSLISGKPATATAKMATNGRIWKLPIEEFHRLDETKPTWSAVLTAGIARDLRSKLARSHNQMG